MISRFLRRNPRARAFPVGAVLAIALAVPALSTQALARDRYAAAVAKADLVETIRAPAFEAAEAGALAAVQRAADADRLKAAAADARQTLVRFVTGMDVAIDKRKTTAARALFRDAARALEDGLDEVKASYDRERPFAVDPSVLKCEGRRPKSSSFPSSHAATGTLFAALLAQAAPERKAELEARGLAYGESRVICGYHYPSDVAAGQEAGRRIAAALVADADFARRLDRVKPALRHMLGL